MANNSIKAAFERMWQHIIAALNEKANKSDLDTKSSIQFITWDAED